MFSSLGRLIGWGFFPLAVLAKLPYAMSVVAVMTSVVNVRGSFAEAGGASALVGLATAFSGPAFGWYADRHGQRGLLLVLACANPAALVALAWALRCEAATVWVLAAAFAIGATSPQAASMVRARWLAAIRLRMDPPDAQRATARVLPYESFTDEAVFVAGPILVGAIAVGLGVVVPLDVTAALTAVGIAGFALHPSAGFVRGHVREVLSPAEPGTPAPAAEASVLTLPVLLPPAGMAAIGAFFGSTLASLTSFLEAFDRAPAAGVYYSVMGIGSALCAFAVVLLPAGFSLAARWTTFAAIALAGSALFTFGGTFPAVMLGLAVTGVGVGPSLVTLFSIAAEVAPKRRVTTVMAMMTTGIVIGQAAASALTGPIIDAWGTRAGFAVTSTACAALVLLSFAHRGLGARTL